MNPVIGSIIAWVLFLLLGALVIHEVRSEPVRYRLLVIDEHHRLHLSGTGDWESLAACRVAAANLRRAEGVLYADCVVAEVGV